MDFFISLLLAYLVGTLPSGLIVARIFKIKDPRTVGSGNIGATNVVRAGGKKAGIVTLLLDAFKAVAVILLLTCYNGTPEPFILDDGTVLTTISKWPSHTYVIGLFTMIGHCFPVWLKFKGGKGVATGLGLIATVHLIYQPDTWWLLAIFAILWIGSYKLTKIVSVASLLTFAALPILTYATYGIWVTPLLVTLLIFIRHKDNIRRLLKGEEHDFSK